MNMQNTEGKTDQNHYGALVKRPHKLSFQTLQPT